MSSTNAKHAFISYVKEDTAQVDALCRLLEAAGVPYWRDRKDLGAGEEWKPAIRRAIQAGSIAFVACFSDNSRRRDTSYMNEELTLAVDEFRKRAPGVTWLLPVRFDDGEIPDWDLGAGRTLGGINYTDLFGADYAVEATKLIGTINRILGVPAADAPMRQASVEEAAPAERAALFRRLTKEMVLDPTRRIELDDLVTSEARRITKSLTDDSDFSLAMPGSTEAEHVRFIAQRAHDLWALTVPLAQSFQVAARWAEGESLTTYAAALRSIATAGQSMQSGNGALLAMRLVPALGLLLTTTLAAAHQERWNNLRRLVLDQQIPNRYEGAEPLILAVHPWSPFRNPDIAEAVARAEVDGADAWEVISKPHGRYRTPVSAWLEHLLRPLFGDQFATDQEYLAAFERAEVFLGVLSQDASSQLVAAGKFGPDSHWFGRATWSQQYSRMSPVAEIQSELQTLQNKWPPLEAGLFGGIYDRAAAALAIYSDNFLAAVHRRF